MSDDRSVLSLSSRQIAVFTAGVLMFLFILQVKSVYASPQWRMISVDIDGVKDASIASFALGVDGTPWMILSSPHYTARTVCYLQGSVWHKLEGKFYRCKLDVSPTGDVYMIEGRSRQTGAIYSLKDKQAVRLTDFSLYEHTGRANLYFDTKGRIWNWGESFFAKFEDGQWERVDVQAGELPHLIEDSHGNVYLFGTTLSYYRDGRFTIDSNLPSFVSKGIGLRSCLWGKDKALFIWHGEADVLTIDLNTLEASYVVRRQPSLPTLGYYDPFRDREGNVWLFTADHPNYPNRYYTVLSAQDGTLSKRPETAAIEWDDNRKNKFGRSVLCTDDGTIYFGAPGNGVYMYQAGKLTHTDWRDGLSINSTYSVYEHPDGTIWFASPRTGIAVYDPKGEKTSPPHGFRDTWTQFDLLNRETVWDFNDKVWVCLADQPSRVSRWDGSAWTHIDVPFDTKGIWEWLIDNLGSIYFTVQEQGRRNAYQIRKGNVRQFKNIRNALVEGVEEGATEFRSSNRFQHSTAPIVTKDKYIWSQNDWTDALWRYDGQQWRPVRGSVEAVIKYKNDQVLIRDNMHRFYTFDQGQMTQFSNEYLQRAEYVLSEVGIFPFDEDAYQQGKDRFFLACLSARNEMFVCRDPNELHRLSDRKAPAGMPGLPWFPKEIWFARGGFWTHINSEPKLVRYYDGLILQVDLASTPIGTTLRAEGCDVYEEENGDLWIRDVMKLFRIKRGLLDTRITSPLSTECRSNSVQVNFAGTRDGRHDDQLAFAWRLDGAPWSAPSKQNIAVVKFSGSGIHTFEVMAVGELGNVDTTPAALKLNAILPLRSR